MVRFLFLFLFLSLSLFAEISALYLSWYGDPTTTMTIQWHTPLTQTEDDLFVQEGEKWNSYTGTHRPFKRVQVHTVALQNLTPDTEYTFRLEKETYKFRTAPQKLPIRFAIGGDAYFDQKLFARMNKTILENDPLFVVIGGDIAYAIDHSLGTFSSTHRWLSFLKAWKEQMITKDGRLIPFLLLPGNHDISKKNFESFFSLFAFPDQTSYRAVDFGSYLSLLLLDTGHLEPIAGPQTLWLKNALETRPTVPYRFPIYHVAAYPSCYPFEGGKPEEIRTHWIPLFEKYKLQAAFENHNHAYKRTHPMNGITYLGDGSWGVRPRKPKNHPYLAKSAQTNSIFLIELTETEGSIKVLDISNQTIDQLTLKKTT